MSALLRRVGCAVICAACLEAAVGSQAPLPQWTPLGPSSGTVFSLARDPFDDRVLLAGTYFGGLYRSEDGGLQWTYAASALDSLPVFAVAFDPLHSGVAYAGTFQSGVFRSDDGGRSWSPRNAGLTSLTIQSLSVDPFDSSVVLVGSPAGVFRTSNGANDWTQVTTLAGQAIVHDPQHAGVVYLGTSANGLIKSLDGGVTWSGDGVNLPAPHIAAVAFDVRTAGALYAAGDGGVYRRATPDQPWVNLSAGQSIGAVTEVVPDPNVDRLFALSDSGIWALAGTSNQWTLWATFERAPRLMTFDPRLSIVLVALEHGGVFATVDDGQSWLDAAGGMQNLFVGALSVSTVSGQTLRYAGTDLGVYVGNSAFDTPGRTNWYRNTDFRQGIFKLLQHPANPSVVFAATERFGIWKTADYGQTWTQTSNGLVPLQIYDLAQSPADPASILAGTSSGLFRSGDGGRTWQPASSKGYNPTYILTVATDPQRPGKAFFGGGNGLVLRTTDYGETVVDASFGLPREYITSLRIAAGGGVYATTGSGLLYASIDDGDNWFHVVDGISAAVRTIEIADAHTMYAGTFGQGVLKSVSGGGTWLPAGALPFPYVFSLAIDPNASAIVYAGTLGVFKSTDAGASWTNQSAGLPPGPVTGLAVDAQQSAIVYASIEGQGVYRSLDGGASWTATPPAFPIDGSVPIHADVAVSGRVLAGTRLAGVFVSDDRGDTWKTASDGMSVFVRGLAIDRQQPSTMYAGGVLGGVYKSTDGGGSWTNVGLNDRQILDVAIHPASSTVVYAATTQGVMLSVSGGNNWIALGPTNALAYGVFVMALAIDPQAPNVIYAGTGGNGVFKSTNAGIEWTAVNTGLQSGLIMQLVVDPKRPQTIYAATADRGVFGTDDGGNSWSPLGAGLFTPIVTSLALDPASPGVIYAGTEGGGLFKLQRP